MNQFFSLFYYNIKKCLELAYESRLADLVFQLPPLGHLVLHVALLQRGRQQIRNKSRVLLQYRIRRQVLFGSMVGAEMVMGLAAALTRNKKLKMFLVWFGSAFHIFPLHRLVGNKQNHAIHVDNKDNTKAFDTLFMKLSIFF